MQNILDVPAARTGKWKIAHSYQSRKFSNASAANEGGLFSTGGHPWHIFTFPMLSFNMRLEQVQQLKSLKYLVSEYIVNLVFQEMSVYHIQ